MSHQEFFVSLCASPKTYEISRLEKTKAVCNTFPHQDPIKPHTRAPYSPSLI